MKWRGQINEKMKKWDKYDVIMYILILLFLIIWLGEVVKGSPSYEDMTVEEQIRVERMIFP